MAFKNPIFAKLLASAFLPIAAMLVVLGLYLTRSATEQPARDLLIIAALVAAVVAFGLAYLFSRSLAGRLRRLRRFAEGLADLNQPVPPLSEIEGKDELAELTRSLRQAGLQLRALEDRIRMESPRFEAILSSLVEGVLVVNNELRVVFCNDSFLRAVGAAGPVPEGLSLLELVREPEILDMLTRVMVSGESCRQRVELSLVEGRSFEAQVAPLVAPSRRGAVAILHDITELERLERVRKDFVANVSHELRTPLTAIQGYAETLLEGALEDPENNRKFLETIRAHAIRLNLICSDLLKLSELESGKAAPAAEKASVREAIEAALRAVEPTARARGVKLAAANLFEIQVLGDRLQLEEALINLLDNGVKFNRPGGEVRVEMAATGEGEVSIVIADDGIGIPSQDLPRIFERFYRVDKARSREVGGTGLGLSIVKHIIERMNGTIRVESQLGKGSTFIIALPVAG